MNIKNFLLFALALIVLQLAIYTIQDKPTIEKIAMKEFDSVVSHLSEDEKKFEDFFFTLDKELMLLKNSNYFGQFVIEDLYKVEVEDFFVHILKEVPQLYQLRYINNNGDEIIRVQREHNSVSLVPRNRLQNKKDRYYFKEIMNSNDSTMWLSKIDYNMENGVIDLPRKKTLRVGISVLVGGVKKGILIANIEMEQFHLEDSEFLQSFNDERKSIYIAF